MNLSLLARFGAAGLLALFLSSCTVVVEEDPFPRPGPQICTQQYDPVCAVRGDRMRTFSNACFASAEGYRPIHPGECRRFSEAPPQFCTREYRPVCAVRGNRMRTFGNACEARAAEYRIIYPGEC